MPRVIKLRPHITEKTLKLAKKGIYTFIGPARYTKDQAAKEITDMFGYNIVQIRVVALPKKIRGKFLRRQPYYKPARKKFYVKFAQEDVVIPGFDKLSKK